MVDVLIELKRDVDRDLNQSSKFRMLQRLGQHALK